MAGDIDRKKQELAKLQERLAELKSTLPEHCSGSGTYVDTHHASVEHWQKIEEAEEGIKRLKAELGL
jgi:predicted translin family RNA/ssDNA-binding protein